jgi:hypothetical protein
MVPNLDSVTVLGLAAVSSHLTMTSSHFLAMTHRPKVLPPSTGIICVERE